MPQRNSNSVVRAAQSEFRSKPIDTTLKLLTLVGVVGGAVVGVVHHWDSLQTILLLGAGFACAALAFGSAIVTTWRRGLRSASQTASDMAFGLWVLVTIPFLICLNFDLQLAQNASGQGRVIDHGFSMLGLVANAASIDDEKARQSLVVLAENANAISKPPAENPKKALQRVETYVGMGVVASVLLLAIVSIFVHLRAIVQRIVVLETIGHSNRE